jgi:RNA polymerase sigma-70 factor, ECF subfamily
MNFDKLIFSVAYNMTGDYERTRDVVQDINLKFLETPIAETVTDKKNYVIRATINYCISLKKKEQRLQYIGTWLPEPIVSDREKRIDATRFEETNLLSYEMAFLMEQLSPTERAVFVLREAFDFGHKEIAEAINISTDNSRQLLKRAKEKVANLKHKSVVEPAALKIAKEFISLISQGNITGLIKLFNDDISVIGDGGGKAPAITKPIFGKEQVAQFFLKLISNKKYSPVFSYTEVLSQPAIVIHNDGELVCVQVLSISEDKISLVFSIVNPDKFLAFKNNSNSLSHYLG